MVPPQPPVSVFRSLRVVASFSTCRRANMVRALTSLRVTLYVRGDELDTLLTTKRCRRAQVTYGVGRGDADAAMRAPCRR
jgi:hypothetical protein